MKKTQRIDCIRRRSREYARSGRFHGWYDIEVALRNQGLKEAHSELDNPRIRQELDELCAFARAARADGLTFDEALALDRAKPEPPA